MSTSSIYFKHAKEQVLYLYPGLDLSLMNFLKVVRDSVLVDNDILASPKSLTHIEGTHDQDGKTKGSEFEVPQAENDVEVW